jgi:hypothetical protein
MLDEAWFIGFGDELARCIADAERCADACERLLAASVDPDVRRPIADAVIAPAAVARVLADLVEQPAPLVLAAARLCRDIATEAAERLDALDHDVDVTEAADALRSCASSCALLLAVVG